MNNLSTLFTWLAMSSFVLTACTKKVERAKPSPPQFVPITLLVSVENDSESECATFRNSLPQDFFQDFVEVPENWNQPDGKKIKVFFYGRQFQEGRTPTIFFNGGPGASSHSSYELMEKNADYQARMQKISLIYMDQRGTGCSDPFPRGDAEALARLRHYGSRNIVLDAEYIRQHAFQGVKWAALGQSYGGDIVYRYLTIAPEGLLAAHIHGSTVGERQASEMSPRLQSQKRISEEYFTVYPQDRASVNYIRSALGSTYCISNRINGACGPAILDGAVYLMAFRNSWEELHNWIEGLISKKNGKIGGVWDDVLINFAKRTFLNNHNFALGAAIAELESVEDSNQTCAQATAVLKKQRNDPDQWSFNECRLFRSMTSEEELSFVGFKGRDPIQLNTIKEALLKSPELPVHVYVGKLDNLVPIEGLERMREVLGDRIHFTVFENSGHEGFLTEESFWTAFGP